MNRACIAFDLIRFTAFEGEVRELLKFSHNLHLIRTLFTDQSEGLYGANYKRINFMESGSENRHLELKLRDQKEIKQATMMDVRFIKKNMYIMLKDHPSRITNIQRHRAGKHSKVKFTITAKDVFHNRKYEEVCPQGTQLQILNPKYEEAEVHDIDYSISMLTCEKHEMMKVPMPGMPGSVKIMKDSENGREKRLLKDYECHPIRAIFGVQIRELFDNNRHNAEVIFTSVEVANIKAIVRATAGDRIVLLPKNQISNKDYEIKMQKTNEDKKRPLLQLKPKHVEEMRLVLQVPFKKSEQETPKREKMNPQSIEFQQWLLCPISSELMQKPVFLSKCGHTFDRGSITQWIRTKSPSCPLCTKEAYLEDITPNYLAVNILSSLEDFQRKTRRGATGKTQRVEVSQQTHSVKYEVAVQANVLESL